jgi:hypothetical protein
MTMAELVPRTLIGTTGKRASFCVPRRLSRPHCAVEERVDVPIGGRRR